MLVDPDKAPNGKDLADAIRASPGSRPFCPSLGYSRV